MSLSRLAYASSARPSFNASDPPAMAPHRHGHAHFWERALSRRQVVRTAAGLAIAGVAGPALSARAQETMSGTPVVLPAGAAPKPIPGGIDLGGGNIIHVYDYSQGWDPSTITDFRGLVGIHHMRGEGTVTVGGGSPLGTPTATSDRLSYDTDMRFMQGTYIGEDGQAREGTFAFI